jgi:predicted transcriptional regulator YdeE
MDYKTKESDSFSVIGQKIQLTNFQKENIRISTSFWKEFNRNLKEAYLSQFGNWTKYAFMEKINGTLFYYCAIPKKAVVPEGFIEKEVSPHKYLVFEHIGPMDRIYSSYEKIYKQILPNSGYELMQSDFLHFEKYDYRFHWNKENSIIEIWIPVY